MSAPVVAVVLGLAGPDPALLTADLEVSTATAVVLEWGGARHERPAALRHHFEALPVGTSSTVHYRVRVGRVVALEADAGPAASPETLGLAFLPDGDVGAIAVAVERLRPLQPRLIVSPVPAALLGPLAGTVPIVAPGDRAPCLRLGAARVDLGAGCGPDRATLSFARSLAPAAGRHILEGEHGYLREVRGPRETVHLALTPGLGASPAGASILGQRALACWLWAPRLGGPLEVRGLEGAVIERLDPEVDPRQGGSNVGLLAVVLGVVVSFCLFLWSLVRHGAPR